jgi:hypothetical protein
MPQGIAEEDDQFCGNGWIFHCIMMVFRVRRAGWSGDLSLFSWWSGFLPLRSSYHGGPWPGEIFSSCPIRALTLVAGCMHIAWLAWAW